MTLRVSTCVGFLLLGCGAAHGTPPHEASRGAPSTSSDPKPDAPSPAAATVMSAAVPRPVAPSPTPVAVSLDALATPPSMDVAPDGVVLTTYFEKKLSDGKRIPLVSGESLHSGEHFWMYLGAREPLYLYVVYAGPDGTATVIYPVQGDFLLDAGQTRRLPAERDFELDDVPGWERLLIVASRRPLAQAEAQLGSVIDRVRSSHQWPESLLPLAPPQATLRPRTGASAARPAAASMRASLAKPKVYDGPTPIVLDQVADAARRGATRGVRLSQPNSGRIDAMPDANGIVAIPFFIEHLR